MNGGDGEIYNIGTGEPTTVKELFSVLKDISGKDSKAQKKSFKEGLQETFNWFNSYSK